mmetsp:Transcript_21088/g.29567  ORF Transcript_21088/g.29567 Transcript_21088/m.29567 type:complete len:579 (-) Transcript_21088:47-1783(-)
MGQCFSATLFANPVQCHQEIPDIKILNEDGTDKYIFSDGIGKISVDFARKTADRHGIPEVPSAFQIRYQGCKGVLAIDPDFQGEIAIRPSMRKFTTEAISDLEIITWSKAMPCYLNRQIISILSTLGVENSVFEKMQRRMLNELDQMLKDKTTAIKLLERCHSDLGLTATLVGMIRSGISLDDPFISVNLLLLKGRLTKEMRKKTRVFVEKGICLIGVLDETRTLKYGQIFVQYKHNGASSPTILKARVGVAKMPAFHPGDFRNLEAIDVPRLHHLCNVVVFPAVGPRPHPNECSGSDLDGDIYWLTWDSDLLPNHVEPMDYTASKPTEVESVSMDHIKEFFVNYIKNDNLGTIANAHLAWADSSPQGVCDPACLRLAALHSIAVDFPKTGVPAVMDLDLRPSEYPNFMENKKKQSRASSKVIGIMYNEVKGFQLPENTSYRITRQDLKLNEQLLTEGYMKFIPQARAQRDGYYFELSAIMNQFGIKSEMEAVSGNIMKCFHSKSRKTSQIRDTVLRAVHSLRKKTLEEFRKQITDLEKKQEAKALASAWYYVCYEPKEKTECVSFAWIPYKFLLNQR